MRPLKLVLLSVFAVIFLVSLSSNTPFQKKQNTIVGTWKFYKSFENNVEDILKPCEDKTTMAFSANGVFSGSNYKDINGACELDDNIIGTWTKRGRFYDISFEEEIQAIKFIFEDNNTFYFEYSYEKKGSTITSKEMFKRQ